MLRNEIGSEFFENPLSDDSHFFESFEGYNYILLENGRECSYFINTMIEGGKLLFPSFACESMLQYLDKSCLEFYNVKQNFSIDLEDLVNRIDENTRAVLYVNYFGFLQSEEVLKFFKKCQTQGIIIIEDTTHSIFTDINTCGDFCIASLRKWAALPDGGIIYSKKEIPNHSFEKNNKFAKMREIAFDMKKSYMFGILAEKQGYLEAFLDAEKYINLSNEINRISDKSIGIIKHLDTNFIKERRRDNYRYLHRKLKKVGFEIITPDLGEEVPMFLVVELDKRDEARQYLIEHSIFCPVHWTKLKEIEDGYDVEKFTKRILSIPIDQRYGIQDMDRIIECLKKWKQEH